MIQADGLTRRFGNLTAVDRLTLSVPDGQILALLGPNGAGKTTTVRMLAGLLAPSAGTATVAGFDVARQPDEVRAVCGMVSDVPGLYEQMNVVDYLDLFGAIYGLTPAECRRRRDELLAMFDLSGRTQEKMVGFSRGMKQKVALARALIHQPAVLYLDEPTSGLDPTAAGTVRDLIRSLREASRSIVLCTHDLDEAERLADEVIIMRQGQVAARGSPARLRQQATGETLVRVEIVGPFPLPVEALADIPGVRNMELATQPTGDGDGRGPVPALMLSYGTPPPRATNPVVLSRIISAGAQVVSVTCETASLEAVYAGAIADTRTVANGRLVAPAAGEPATASDRPADPPGSDEPGLARGGDHDAD